jgi:hypothetical protein
MLSVKQGGKMERDRYTYSDWMMLLVAGTFLLEGLAPHPTFANTIVAIFFAVTGRLSIYLFQFIPLRAPWVYLAPGLIAVAVFHFGLEGLMYYITHTPLIHAGEDLSCPLDPKDKNDQQTPLPEQLKLLG